MSKFICFYTDLCTSQTWSNFRIPRNSFTYHWIRIASIVSSMPRSSKPPDTCKWGGPKLRGILKFSLDDSNKVISISTLGLDPFVSRHVEINFFCLVFQAPCQKFVVSHWGKTSSLVASGSSSTNSKAWKSGPKSKESTACVHKRKRTDVKEKPIPSKA